MSNPDNAAAQNVSGDDGAFGAVEKETTPKASESKDFASQVNDLASQMVYNEGTKVFDLPEGEYSPELKTATMSEKRRRDTQGALSKSQQKLAASQAENKALRKRAVSSAPLIISAEVQQELSDLKFSDPDAWRTRINELEQEANVKTQEELDTIAKDTSQQGELERRKDVMIEFVRENPEFVLNNEVLENDVPPRITNKLKEGKITFEAFLEEVHVYLSTDKIVNTKEVDRVPNLSDVGGDAHISKPAMDKDIITSYANETY